VVKTMTKEKTNGILTTDTPLDHHIL